MSNNNAEDENQTETDWNLCVLCQEKTEEILQCPAESKRPDVGAGYRTLAQNIIRFSELDNMPIYIALPRLDDGKGMENTFLTHKARWHKSCNAKFNSTKLKRAEKRCSAEQEGPSCKRFMRSASHSDSPTPIENCFFCEGAGTKVNPLHSASTFGLDSRIRDCAVIVQDEALLAKLSAIEAKYHSTCLVSLYNRARSVSTESVDKEPSSLEGIALAELVSYLEESRMNTELPVFKLVELSRLYSSRIEQLGVNSDGRLHTSRLKDRLLAQIPQLEAYKQGRDVLLAFKEDVGLALQRVSYEESCDTEGLHLAKAANIVRRDMQELKHSFNGSFDKMCQENAVPSSLLCLINMILHGPNIQSQSSKTSVQSALSIAQLLQITALCVAVRELLNVNDTTETRKRHFPSTLACLFTQKHEAVILWIVFMI